jgi:hypothetical protein
MDNDEKLKNGLESLPQEVRNDIYRLELTKKGPGKGEYDIDIYMDANGQSIWCSALDFIDQLDRDNRPQLEEVRDFLFHSNVFRYIIKDTCWPPHRPLTLFLKRLEKYPSGRRGVKKLTIERFTAYGVDLGAKQGAETHISSVPLPKNTDRSPFLVDMMTKSWLGYLKYRLTGDMVLNHIRHELRRTIELLPQQLPNLEYLELELDVIDCFPEGGTGARSLGDTIKEYDRKGWGDDGKLFMKPVLRKLKHQNRIRSLDIRVHWSDFFRRNRRFNIQISKSKIREYEDAFLQVLRDNVPARNITHYRDSE